MPSLVDSNILLDVLAADESWSGWSKLKLAEAADSGPVVINPIIYAEASVRYAHRQAFDSMLSVNELLREHLPWEAAFEAGRAQLRYRQQGGVRERTLPDFLIGAHAAVKGYRLLTRDARRYRAYFPDLDIIAPDTHP